jgi:hypothetical protein
MWNYGFSLHGMELTYETSCAALRGPVLNFLRHFHRRVGAGLAQATIRFSKVPSRNAIPVALSPSARTIFVGSMSEMGRSFRCLWRCEIQLDSGRVVADFYDRGLLVVDGHHGVAEGYFVDPEAMDPNVCRDVFQFVLAELLKRRNMFLLQASVVEYRGQGVVILGRPGQGRTTALVSLVRSGFLYLSDDHVLLRECGTQMELLGFPTAIEVTDQTIEMVPELRAAKPGILKQGICKKSFESEDVYPHSAGGSCFPAMVLLLNLSDVPHSCMEPLPKSRTLDAILPETLPVHDPVMAGREFHALSRLVQQADCYRLHFGRDVLELPDVIRPLLATQKSA